MVRWLYTVAPGEFVEEREGAARRAGSRDDAARIRKLRRPTVAAWAVNLLVADAPEDIDELIDLGERLRAAQAEMRGTDLRELSAERNRVVSRLVRHASGLAREAGQRLAGAAERDIETTLDAAVADPESAEAIRAGTLTKALSYSGTGFTGAAAQVFTSSGRTEAKSPDRTERQARAKSPAREGIKAREGTQAPKDAKTREGAPARKDTKAREGTPARKDAKAREDARAHREAEARREARRRAVEKAEAEVERAKRRRTEARDALDAARERRESAAAERHRLRTELNKAERALTRADDRVEQATTKVDNAESALDQARHHLTEAKSGRIPG